MIHNEDYLKRLKIIALIMAKFKYNRTAEGVCLWYAIICGLHFAASASVREAGNFSPKNLWQEAGFTYGTLEPKPRYPRQEGESDIVFSEENEQVFRGDPFNDAHFSEKELDCFAARKFLYNNECHVLSKTGPCASDEWLILEKESVLRHSYLRAVCKKKPCTGKEEVWWPKSNKCELKSTIQNEECQKKGMKVQVDAYGDGICACTENFGEVVGKNKCYEYYQQGPCATNQVVTFEPSTGNAICSIDKCMNENRRLKTRDVHRVGHYGDTSFDEMSEQLSRRKRASPKGAPKAPLKIKEYAPFDGVGKCLKLGLADPCIKTHIQSRYVIDKHIHVPRCSIPDIQLHVVDAPVLCRTNDKNECRDNINIKQEDRSAYLSDLKNQFKKKNG